MKSLDKIYQVYLNELQELEKFRTANSLIYGETPLESEDPYTKRLIESLAFFGARAKLQAVNQVTQIHQRLFRQYFSYLVNPLPTFGMLQVTPSIRCPEKIVLAQGSEFLVNASRQFKATFQMLDELEVWPLFLKKSSFERNPKGGWRFVMEYASLQMSTEEVGSLRFYINHLSSFFPSLKVAFTMMKSLERVAVFYDSSSLEGGEECSFRFGLDASKRTVFYQEIEQLRTLFHMPQQELFLTFDIPPCRKRWQMITFCLDFNDKWPETILLNSDSLIPFVVPIANLKKALADPILCDGTQERYPLLYPDPQYRFEVHTVLAVSEVLAKGKKPLEAAILGTGNEGYEIDYFNQELFLDMPSAFKNPKLIAIDALWTQPLFSNYVGEKLTLHFSEAQNYGLSVSLLGTLSKYEKTIEEDPNFLIRILSLKNQSHLKLKEIFFILKAMKNLTNSFFGEVLELITDLTINQKKDEENYRSVIEYEFFLKEMSTYKWEVTVLFFRYLVRLLYCWLPNFEIEVKAHLPKQKKPLLLKGGMNYELSTLARDLFPSH